MSDKPNVPTEAGYYWLLRDGRAPVVVYAVHRKKFDGKWWCVRTGRAGYYRPDEIGGTWGARIPEDAPLKAMREVVSTALKCGEYPGHASSWQECRLCGAHTERDWGAVTHAPDCAWLRAREDET